MKISSVKLLILTLIANVNQAVNGDVSKQSPGAVKKLSSFSGVNAICVLSNAIRIDPKLYISQFGNANTKSSCAASSQPQRLLFMDSDLSEAANFHAVNMAKANKLTHDSLDGSADKSFSTRIKRFFKQSGTLAENIADGTLFEDPLTLMDAWINSEGHCENLMSSKYNTVGVGFAKGSNVFADQDFAGVSTSIIQNKIACGSHVIQNKNVLFLVAVKSGNAAPTVVINGKSCTMKSLSTGSDGAIFQADGASCGVTGQGGCLNYHFLLGSEQYPEGFDLQTEGVGSCKETI